METNAYSIRSSLGQGDSPSARYLKLKGERADLHQVIAATDDVVRQALKQALRGVMTGIWPPDWIALLLSD